MKIIISKQKKFFTSQGKKINTLKISDIANELNLSSSTVSRAVKEKYIKTNFGIISLRKLFNLDSTVFLYQQKILEYSWPGNIRELKNTIEYCMNMIEENEKTIDLKHLPPKFLENKEKDEKIKTLKELEKEAISNLLKIYGNSSEAKKIIAKSLGVGIATLYRKLNFYNL